MRMIFLNTAAVFLVANGVLAMDHSMMHHGDHDSDRPMMQHTEEKEHLSDSTSESARSEADPRLEQIEHHMAKLDFLGDEIADAATPAERRGLMRKHITEMQGLITTMQQMMWCCLPSQHDGGEHGQHMGTEQGGGKEHGDGQTAYQLNAIFQRLKVMQQLMGQMVEQQSFLLDALSASPGH